jgi:hypothetical protein
MHGVALPVPSVTLFVKPKELVLVETLWNVAGPLVCCTHNTLMVSVVLF